MIARDFGASIADLATLVQTMRDAWRRWRHARAAAARETLYDSDRGQRERYFAAASDAADLERRQRGWDRVHPNATPWP